MQTILQNHSNFEALHSRKSLVLDDSSQLSYSWIGFGMSSRRQEVSLKPLGGDEKRSVCNMRLTKQSFDSRQSYQLHRDFLLRRTWRHFVCSLLSRLSASWDQGCRIAEKNLNSSSSPAEFRRLGRSVLAGASDSLIFLQSSVLRRYTDDLRERFFDENPIKSAIK